MRNSLDLFDASVQLESIHMPDADVRFMHAFYSPAVAGRLQDILMRETPWRQEEITLWGKQHLQPRLTCWYGHHGDDYSYSGIELVRNEWTPTLLQIRRDIESVSGHRFNSVLLNLYRDEHDSVGMHSDDEPEFGQQPVIASLSLGETRVFRLKHKTRRELKSIAIELTDGSLLVMAGATQQYWRHGINKENQNRKPRINLTFRTIVRRRD